MTESSAEVQAAFSVLILYHLLISTIYDVSVINRDVIWGVLEALIAEPQHRYQRF